MKENYAEVLESYMIPAEEGLMDKIKSGIKTAATVTQLSGVIAWELLKLGFPDKDVNRIKKENVKIKKSIRHGDGTPRNYYGDTYYVFRAYYNGINTVSEPININEITKFYQYAYNVAKAIDEIRNMFAKIDHNNPNYSSVLSKLKTILNTLSKNQVNSNWEPSNYKEKPFKQSNIYQIFDLEQKIMNILWGKYLNRNNVGGEWIFMYPITGEWDKYNIYNSAKKHPDAQKCIEIYDEIYEILDKCESKKFINQCKLGIDPKTYPKGNWL